MIPTAVFCLHGFLGLPADWNILDDVPVTLEKVDLFASMFSTQGSMLDWAKSFNAHVRAHYSSIKQTPRALLGYSMGGRLALHALVDDPTLWDAALLVSTNPGASLPGRLEQDERWARRFERSELEFETEGWEQLIADWNALPVFEGSAPMPERLEADFKRAQLAHALRSWSPAVTGDLSDQINHLKLPLHWTAGARDQRYVAMARKISKNPAIIDGAGHRAPWDQPVAFREYFCGFLEQSLLKKRH